MLYADRYMGVALLANVISVAWGLVHGQTQGLGAYYTPPQERLAGTGCCLAPRSCTSRRG